MGLKPLEMSVQLRQGLSILRCFNRKRFVIEISIDPLTQVEIKMTIKGR